MRYRKGLLLILFVLFFQSAAYGGSITNNVNISRLIVFEREIYETTTEGQPFFLFSNITFKAGHSGSVIAIFSTINLDSAVTGDFAAFYCDVTVSESSRVDGFFFDPPDILVKLAISVIRIFALLIIVSFHKSFFEQGFGVCMYNKKSALKVGLTIYFFAFALGFVFLLAVFTYPITALIIFFVLAASLCGEVSLGMYVGYTLFLLWKKHQGRFTALTLDFSFNSFANIVTGGIIIECLSFIPFIGLLYSYFILPVICIGILLVSALNAVLYKKFYQLPYLDTYIIENNVRDILTEGLE